MSDKSSGRNPATNSGSDSAVHHKGTAHSQYSDTAKVERSTPVTNRHPNGAVGNGKPGKSSDRSDVRS
ncbi:hypothetical protein NE850_23120 [Paraburkholderia sp. USG1]|uniref:hypothetical protein n=1 Tax=Paraburkholderia sp. USG1 TaxID=2952268 RepID=UPI0028582169|nr:hypothetical protein [Paraburkholderia sp. USG1]MDR8399217.1 hypothetical protein [Paraburkholderia sp. USG1]